MSGAGLTTPAAYLAAAEEMRDSRWGGLDFFVSGRAAMIAANVDAMVEAGVHVLPPASMVFNALKLTAPDDVRVVVLGQDPYPTPGDAHGLAFSVEGRNRKLPMSLRTILEAIEQDTGLVMPGHGDLSQWARNGVLLLNTVLTVEAGRPNAHKQLGWQQLAHDVLRLLDSRSVPVVFMLWGNQARATGIGLDRTKHCIVETVHPSPLARGTGPQHRFVAARPFARADEWLANRGLPPLDWSQNQGTQTIQCN